MLDIISIINTHFENILLGSLVLMIILIILTLSSGAVIGAGAYSELIFAIIVGIAGVGISVLHKNPKFIPQSYGQSPVVV
jgi:hypothetical protein